MTTVPTPATPAEADLQRGARSQAEERRACAIATSLDPACFSIVMATGIVSLACWQQGAKSGALSRVAEILLWINVPIFLGLLGLSAIRVFSRFEFVRADLFAPQRAFGFFSTIAASGVLGVGVLKISNLLYVPTVLYTLSLLALIFFTYIILLCITVNEQKAALNETLHGGWLLIVVAAQSVSLLGIGLLGAAKYREELMFLSLSLWLVGAMLYMLIIAVIFYRYCFMPIAPDAMTPPYWINMGAVAISTLAGTALIAEIDTSSTLGQFLPFVKGLTLFCWVAATWWIPLLILLGAWRHLYKRVRIRYELRYWSMVFPLGMYAVATSAMHDWLGYEFLVTLSIAFTHLALVAWGVTFLGLLLSLSTALQLLKNPSHLQ